MPKPVDIVIPLGTGSKHGDIELQYCLRAVDKFLRNVGSVYIVGNLPQWKIQNIIHLPAPDDDQKEVNILNKILLACRQHHLTEDFLFMNDDHFIIQPSDAAAYPYYHKGLLDASIARRVQKGWTQGYFHTLKNTLDALQQNNLPYKHFDIHTPVLYNKRDFRTIVARYNWHVPNSMAIKSIYCNTKRILGVRMAECRINTPMNIFSIHDKVRSRPVFSIGDEGVNVSMLNYLNDLFPEKSKYEI